MGPVLICESWKVASTFLLLSRTRWKMPRQSVLSFGGNGPVKVDSRSHLEGLAPRQLVPVFPFLCSTPLPLSLPSWEHPSSCQLYKPRSQTLLSGTPRLRSFYSLIQEADSVPSLVFFPPLPYVQNSTIHTTLFLKESGALEIIK